MTDAKERGKQLMSVSVTDMWRSMTGLMLGRSLYGSAFLTMAVRTFTPSGTGHYTVNVSERRY